MSAAGLIGVRESRIRFLPVPIRQGHRSRSSIQRKRDWAERVFEELADEGLLAEGTRLVFHAGRDYVDELLPFLEDAPVTVETPTDGLRFGETLAWYNDRL